MKITFLIIIIILVIFISFYGGYYFINPSNQGKKILDKYNINYPTVIAHRGASFKAPELTKPAFKKSLNLGSDYIEVDIHRTKDGVLIALHDNNLKRTSNIEEIYPNRKNDHVSTFTYEELLKLDFGSWFNRKYPKRAKESYKNLNIVSLGNLLDIIDKHQNSSGIILDLKDTNRYPNLTEAIFDLLIKKEWYDIEKNTDDKNYFSKIMIFSTNLEILKEFKNKMPDIPRVLLLTNNKMGKRKWKNWLDLAEGFVNGIGIKGFISWPWNIAMAHEKGMFVFPYVINKNWQLRIMSHLNSNGYITDRPELVLEFLDRIYDFGAELE